MKTRTRKKPTKAVISDAATAKLRKKKRLRYPKTVIPAPVTAVACTDEQFSVTFKDGRVLSVPLDWYPRLALASPPQRENYEISYSGIHWPDVDEDISIQALLDGKRSVENIDVINKSLKSKVTK